MTTFGDYIQRARIAKGFPLKDAALRMGIEPKHLQALEAGTCPPGRELTPRIMSALGVITMPYARFMVGLLPDEVTAMRHTITPEQVDRAWAAFRAALAAQPD